MQRSLDLAPDSVVGGRYRLIEALAHGGTASVWRAHDERMGRDIAMKILRDEGVDATLRERAGREARVLAGLDHPNIVRVYDGGDDDGVTYIVMALLQGETLRAIIDRRGAVPLDEAAELVADVADGLGAAHARGVIHRDVKPANIICHDQVPTLVDFGIARSMDATTLTRGLVLGTASYLSPEQAQGAPLTPAVDVYALGCVLYELLTGQPPFRGDNPVTVALQHVQDDPASLADRADIPPAMNELVLRCLAKDPARRPADGTELAIALRAAADADPSDDTAAIAPSVVDGTMVMPAVGIAPPVSRPARRPTPTIPWPIVLAAAAVVIAIVLASRLSGGIAEAGPAPDVVNKPADVVQSYLEASGLDVEVVNVASDRPVGIVVSSEPAVGEPLASNGTVTLSVSSGPAVTPTTAAPEPDEGRGRDKPNKPGRGDRDDD